MSHILVVDDDTMNLQILADFLNNAGYQLSFAQNGEQAWQMLQSDQHHYDLVILDRIMPKLNGIQVLQRIKAEPRFKELPVIMQTAASEAGEVAEGLASGAWYYLAKPYRRDALLNIIRAALDSTKQHKELAQLSLEVNDLLTMLDQAHFRFYTPEQINPLAAMLSRLCDDPDVVAMGLSELMLNAIEHGNLNISYHEKGLLLETNTWRDEVERRLQMAEHQDKCAHIRLQRREDGMIEFEICDTGKGFDWQNYLYFDAQRAFDTHGRGIAMAKQLAFQSLEYQENGNRVIVTALQKR